MKRLTFAAFLFSVDLWRTVECQTYQVELKSGLATPTPNVMIAAQHRMHTSCCGGGAVGVDM